MIYFSLFIILSIFTILNEQHYSDLLDELITHSLLHLYLTMADSRGFTPVVNRNKILVRFIKPKLKDPKYSRLKNELRMLLSVGRYVKGNLEAKLIEVNTLPSEKTDAQHLFDLLETLRCETGIDSRFVNVTERRLSRFVYLLQEQLENNFSKEGKLINPLSLFFELSKEKEVIKIIDKTGWFKVEIQQEDGINEQKHILLYQ